MGCNVHVFHDDVNRNARDNVNSIVGHHNGQIRDLDVSVHFNAVGGGTRDAGIGVETLYRTGNAEMRRLAGQVSKNIAGESGLILRHPWREVHGTVPRTDLGFLNNTNRPAILLEVCFVNSRKDAELYNRQLERICYGIAKAISGVGVGYKPAGQHPIEEKNLQAMVYRGVMQSPYHWRAIDDIQWLNELLAAASVPGRLDRRIDNGITDFETALEVLIDAGIINSPDYWRGVVTYHAGRYIDQLIINIANRSRNVLERIIHAEARGEDLRGQILVGNVIMNRSNAAGFPNGIRNVVFASGINGQGAVTYQFSPVGNGAYARAVDISATTRQAVDHVLNGADYSRGATFFRSVRGLEGSWHQQALTHLFTHGGHAFFR